MAETEEPLSQGTTENSPLEREAPAASAETEGTPAAQGVAKLFPSPGFRLDLGHLLNRGGIGFEEILLIGLILLLSQSETKDDLIFLLVLLLFIQ